MYDTCFFSYMHGVWESAFGLSLLPRVQARMSADVRLLVCIFTSCPSLHNFIDLFRLHLAQSLRKYCELFALALLAQDAVAMCSRCGRIFCCKFTAEPDGEMS